MKNVIYSKIIIILMVVLSLSCKKEKNDVLPPSGSNPPASETVNKYIELYGGSYVNAAFPVSNGLEQNKPKVDSVNGNKYIIPGGSNPLTIYISDPQNNSNKIYFGINNVFGYYYRNISSQDTIMTFPMIKPDYNKDSLIFVIAISDIDGNISNHYQIPLSLVEVGTGKLQVSLSWDLLNDIDLYLVDPSGDEIYYGNPVSMNNGQLDLDSNPACFIDSINNENITFGDSSLVEKGIYKVRVNFYQDCIGNGNTNYFVSTRINGDLVNPLTGQNPYSGFYLPGTANFGGFGAGNEVMTFEVSSSFKNERKVVRWDLRKKSINQQVGNKKKGEFTRRK